MPPFLSGQLWGKAEKSSFKQNTTVLVQKAHVLKSFWNRYTTGFRMSLLWTSFVVIALFYIFKEPIFEKSVTLLVNPILSRCPVNNRLIDMTLLGFGLLAIICLVRRIGRSLLPTPGSLLTGAAILFIYFVYCRHAAVFSYYTFHLPLLHNIAYLDVFLVATLILLGGYRTCKRPLEKPASIYSFIEDAPEADDQDALFYSGYMRQVLRHILATTTSRSSFAIAVVGLWGSGKTYFLKKLQKALQHKDQRKDNIVFEFNPWRTSKPDAIVEEFFTGLAACLKSYNRSIVPQIRDYSRRILQTSKEAHFRLLDTFISEWLPEKDLRERYDAINTAIQQTGKRLIVFIDDLDRLSGKEIMEVLRIIRNTGNFANTFFIAAYEEQYIIRSIANTKEYAHEEGYLKKVFQLVLPLPAFKKEILTRELKRHLFTDDFTDRDKKKMEGILKKLAADPSDIAYSVSPAASRDNLFEKLIHDIRDVKRFCNSFKIAFHMMKEETDIHDLFVLEMIRNNSLATYNLIRSRKLFDFDIQHPEKYTISEKDTPAVKSKELREAIRYLLSREGYKNDRRFEFPVNFYLYFAYHLEGLVPIQEFNDVLKMPVAKIIDRFEQWSVELRHEELFRLTGKIMDKPNIALLERMLEVMLRMPSNFKIWLTYASDFFFRQSDKNHSLIFNSELTAQRDFALRVLGNNAIIPYRRALLVRDFLEAFRSPVYNRSSKQLIFSRQEWQAIMLRLFKEYLKNLSEVTLGTLDFLKMNEYTIDIQNRLILYKLACHAFEKKLLTDKKLFADYISLVIRPDAGNLTFEPWLKQIFPDYAVFVKQLEASNEVPSQLKRIILENVLPFYNEEREYFTPANAKDRAFMDDWMQKHLQVTIQASPLIQAE